MMDESRLLLNDRSFVPAGRQRWGSGRPILRFVNDLKSKIDVRENLRSVL
jgi:hypothetical protein